MYFLSERKRSAYQSWDLRRGGGGEGGYKSYLEASFQPIGDVTSNLRILLSSSQCLFIFLIHSSSLPNLLNVSFLSSTFCLVVSFDRCLLLNSTLCLFTSSPIFVSRLFVYCLFIYSFLNLFLSLSHRLFVFLPISSSLCFVSFFRLLFLSLYLVIFLYLPLSFSLLSRYLFVSLSLRLFISSFFVFGESTRTSQTLCLFAVGISDSRHPEILYLSIVTYNEVITDVNVSLYG